MVHYVVIGEYQDPSEKNGVVKFTWKFNADSNVVGGIYMPHTDDPMSLLDEELQLKNAANFVLGHLRKETDEQVRNAYGPLSMKLIEKKYSNWRNAFKTVNPRSTILWHIHSRQDSIVGKFNGERIESLDSVMFDTDYDKFDNNFSKAASRGQCYPVKFEVYKK